MDSDVISLYRDVDPVEVNKQVIIYGVSVLEVGSTPSIQWDRWLGMYKSYQSGLSQKDQFFPQLRKILVHLFGEDTVNYIDSISFQALQVWRRENGRY